jgi:hypothetical protein
MGFTNTYDVTYPADTQLANLLGSDLRALALNVQQRMAAISGLDANKPNFAGDAQPANWMGILYFATDTGQAYQFNGTTWTAVTTDLLTGTKIGFFPAGIAPVSGPSTWYYNPITSNGNLTESAEQIAMPIAGVFKSIYVYTTGAQPASGTLVVNIRINGATQISNVIAAGAAAGAYNQTGSAAFNANDLFDIEIINNATATGAAIRTIAWTY